jgi:hypothetical protein
MEITVHREKRTRDRMGANLIGLHSRLEFSFSSLVSYLNEGYQEGSPHFSEELGSRISVFGDISVSSGVLLDRPREVIVNPKSGRVTAAVAKANTVREL